MAKSRKLIPMPDVRKLKRWNLVYYLRIYDRETGAVLGHLADITTDGLMILSDEPISMGKRFKLRLEVPGSDREEDHILVEADSLWCGRDVNPEFHDTGFKFVKPSLKAVMRIKCLIDDLKLEG